MGFVGLFRAPDKGPEQPCEVSFLSLPQGARHNGRGGRDSPGPSPPSSPFPPQAPKDKIVGLSSEASSESGCKEGFSSWDRRSLAHPLLKNPKIFQLAGLKTQKNNLRDTGTGSSTAPTPKLPPPGALRAPPGLLLVQDPWGSHLGPSPKAGRKQRGLWPGRTSSCQAGQPPPRAPHGPTLPHRAAGRRLGARRGGKNPARSGRPGLSPRCSPPSVACNWSDRQRGARPGPPPGSGHPNLPGEGGRERAERELPAQMRAEAQQQAL